MSDTTSRIGGGIPKPRNAGKQRVLARRATISWENTGVPMPQQSRAAKVPKLYETIDVARGQKLVERFKPFLCHLLTLNLSRKTEPWTCGQR
jgi:hypothetical protein